MFWADTLVDKITQQLDKNIAQGKPLIIRDEKTMSGRVHVGSLRGVVLHGIISEILTERKIANKYLFEINDFDPFDGLPHYLDQDKYRPYMGFSLKDVPSPDDKFPNFAEYVADEFVQVINQLGFQPELYRLYPLYQQGKFNETIRLALEHAAEIREIYKNISGSVKADDWYPLQVICDSCGKMGTTKVTGFDGEKVQYRCEPNLVKWAQGCGHQGSKSPFDGNAKLPWKVDWAAKFKVLNVDIEGGGKDHYTKGGSREISNAICEKIFQHTHPYDLPYNFFVIGGKKMSSSKGLGSTAKDISDLLPPEMVRLLMLRNRPQQEIDFDPQGDTIPVLYDYHDQIAGQFFTAEPSDGGRLFALIFPVKQRKKIEQKFYPRFSLIAYLSQMPHIDLILETEKMKGSKLTKADKAEVDYRSKYALNWLELYSPEKFKIKLYEDSMPEAVKTLSAEQKQALKAIADYLVSIKQPEGQLLHTKLHELKTELNIDPRLLFEAIYKSLLNQDSGPKAGWFLSVLDKQFLINRFNQAAE